MVDHVASLLEVYKHSVADGASREQMMYHHSVGEGRAIAAKAGLAGV